MKLLAALMEVPRGNILVMFHVLKPFLKTEPHLDPYSDRGVIILAPQRVMWWSDDWGWCVGQDTTEARYREFHMLIRWMDHNKLLKEAS